MSNEIKKEFNPYKATTKKQQAKLKKIVSKELLKEKDAFEKHEYYEGIRKASIVADNYHFPEPIYAHQVLEAFVKVAHIMGNENPIIKEVMVVGEEMRRAYDYSNNKPKRLNLLLELTATLEICWEKDFHQKVEFFRTLNYSGAVLEYGVIEEIWHIVDNAESE